jgi:hypothetical protein
LPAAHPSAWPDAARPDAVWSAADSQPRGDQASEDAWWRGESEIWWRAGARSAGEADYDDISGLGEPSELADADDLSDAGAPDETGGPDQPGGPDEADATGETDDQGGAAGGPPARSARRTPGPAGRNHGRRDGHWSEAGGPRPGPDHGSYRPWFSPDVSGVPWFAAGPEYQAGS